MIGAWMIGAAALLAAQDGGRPVSDLSPAEAALQLQGYLAQGMAATYGDGETSEGRYVSFTENSLTLTRRGYRHPGAGSAGGWYMTQLHIHRFDLEPVTVSYDARSEHVIVTLRCEARAGSCIMAASANPGSPVPAEERDYATLSLGFAMPIYEDSYAEEMEQLFEIWRSAPEVALAPVIYD
ncbi:MAG: hypothetical protein NXI12_06545 [Alphaproteobacteria bacterium]|nr:hypothetical protein [Alphaproteobacteria bacterium]